MCLIKPTKDNKFSVSLKAGNNEILLSGEGIDKKAEALESVIACAQASATRYFLLWDKVKDERSEWLFDKWWKKRELDTKTFTRYRRQLAQAYKTK